MISVRIPDVAAVSVLWPPMQKAIPVPIFAATAYGFTFVAG